MASFVGNIRTKSYQNLIIGFKFTVKNVGDVFLRHSVVHLAYRLLCYRNDRKTTLRYDLDRLDSSRVG